MWIVAILSQIICIKGECVDNREVRLLQNIPIGETALTVSPVTTPCLQIVHHRSHSPINSGEWVRDGLAQRSRVELAAD